MQPNELNAGVEPTLLRLGYPSIGNHKDVWVKPLAALGITDEERHCISVAYWEGFPRAVVAYGIRSETVLAYVRGPAFSQPPPIVLVFNSSGHAEAFKRDGNQFQVSATAPVWRQTIAEPPGSISPAQAAKVIEEVAEGNRSWFQDDRSRRVVGVLPRIFPEGTAILYELLQNAADCGATSAAFRLESDSLLFLHDGSPFTENDVNSISFVNSSMKPPGTIGFMGLGFKAAYEVSDQPEVHSPPFCFRFDHRQAGGELFPISTACADHTSLGSYSTSFRFPLREQARALISNEIDRFDGRPLLYIGNRLRRITTPNGDFRLHRVRKVGECETLAVSEWVKRSRTEYAVFSRELEPSAYALEEFARDRNLEVSQCEGRKQQISIAIALAGGIPDATRSGRLQVYLPTDVRLPTAFDVQGNFLIGASRQELRNASGPWNREHFQMLPMLVADVLEWAKAQNSHTASWANWYDLIPDWQELEAGVGPSVASSDDSTYKIGLSAAFAEELAKRKLIPAIDTKGSLVFVAPEEATVIVDGLEETLPVGDLSGLSGLTVISPMLSEEASTRLAGYLGRFGPAEFKAAVEDSAWIDHVGAFSRGTDSKQARLQLAKVLAHLERERDHYKGGLGKCVIILTQDGQLRAAEQHGARKVRALPEADIAFPVEELTEQYDVVHPAFRRELNRPGDMNLDPGITQDAVKTLERVAPTLGPRRIATDIILPLFRGERWQEIPDERLLRYTRFLMQHTDDTKAAIDNSAIKVKVRGPTRQYLPPKQTYFGSEYSIEGERLDRFCANAEGVQFLSDDYLRQAPRLRDNWVRFFSSLGVTTRPRVFVSTRHIYENDMDELRKSTGETTRSFVSLRSSSINGIKASHYELNDFVLDPPILETIRKLYNAKPSGWRDRLADFATMLEAGWADYQRSLRKQLRYAVRYSSSIQRKRVSVLTTFARFLKDEPWLPVADLHASRRPSELVLNTENNRALSDRETPLAFCAFEDHALISYLEIQPHPADSTALLRLRNAVDRQETERNVFQTLYMELATDPGLDMNSLREEFREHPLVFAPDPDPRYITSREAVYVGRTILAPHMVAIKDAYSGLEKFFTESLGVAKVEELGHFVEFLRDYVWKARPPITDNLRSAVESCYRRFFNYLNETQDEDREAALASLKEQLGSPAVVFCGAQGWVDTTKTTVVYPDMPAYEGFLASKPEIAIESHLKRLAQPLSEIQPILDALNVRPISSAIRMVPEIRDAKLHSQSDLLGEHLSLLVRKAVAMVEREQAQTESTSRNVTLFLREWRRSEAPFGDVRFRQSPLINVRAELVDNATLLVEMRRVAYVSMNTDHLDIYVSGDLVEVFDAIADQLRHILRFDLLPAGLRDEVASLVQSNLARLDHQWFGVYLNQRLREKGVPVEEDEELQRIVQSATQHIEAEAHTGSASHTGEYEQESEPDNPIPPTSGSGSGGSGSNGGQGKPQPKAPTAEEILAKLPRFHETSYGGDSVIDLSGTSQWQIPTPSGPKTRVGGGSGGGGGFRTAQAYRDAYGKRGEQWVVEQERRALIHAGKPDLADRVVHKSQSNEGSPWDIESFEKSHPHKPIYVEVKSTSEADDFDVYMSVDQVRAALQSPRPYYLYRVVNVHTSKPAVYIYNFKGISRQIQFSATNVSVTLPRPEKPPQ